jgi:hypothetical protein
LATAWAAQCHARRRGRFQVRAVDSSASNVDAEGLAIAKHLSEPSRSRRILDELRHDLPHPRRPFVSYPDQCCLTVLKRAMLLHLDM